MTPDELSKQRISEAADRHDADELLDRMAGVHRDGSISPAPVPPKPGSLMKNDIIEEMFHPERYVDRTGTDDKPNPMTDVFLEFPLAMRAIARVTQVGAVKHSSRGWQTFDPVYGKRYHESKMGRHLLAFETSGFDNPEDGLNHPAQVAWNTLAWLENVLKIEGNEAKIDHPLVFWPRRQLSRWTRR